MLIGNARYSTSNQDLTAQRHALHGLGVNDDMVHVDHGFTGTKRDRPGLKKDPAACRNGDTFVVTKLDRLARSLPDARDIADELTRKGVILNIGGSIYYPMTRLESCCSTSLAWSRNLNPTLFAPGPVKAWRWRT